jgi:hypothetical protein
MEHKRNKNMSVTQRSGAKLVRRALGFALNMELVMKRYLIAGTALLMMAGSTLAQQPPAPPVTPGNSAPPADAPAPPPPKPHGPDGDGPRGHMPPPPPPRGAHIKVENGDTKIDLRCAEADTTEACADIVMKLLDKN